jgi:hypothetical protein
MDEESRRKREELARAALLYAGSELLDYSEEDEVEEGKSKEEEEMEVDGKEVQKGGNEVFLSSEEEAKVRAEAAAAMDKAASMEDAKKARERRRSRRGTRGGRTRPDWPVSSDGSWAGRR